MSGEKNNMEEIDSNLKKLSMGSPKIGEPGRAVQQPPMSYHSQLSGDIHARIMAFQQKRQNPVGESPTGLTGGKETDTGPGLGIEGKTGIDTEADGRGGIILGDGAGILSRDNNNIASKPLPPLPTRQARSMSLSDAANPSNIPSPGSPNLRSIISRAPSGVNPQAGARIPNGGSPKGESKGLGISKKPSLSQRRGLKLNFNDLSDNPTSGQSQGESSPQTIPNSGNDHEPKSADELTRSLSEKRNKHSFKLNLDDVAGATKSSNSNVSSATSLSSDSPLSEDIASRRKPQLQGLFANYSKYVDIKSGSLNFAGKASLHSKGIDFSSGSSFRISLDELEFLDELGHGNYGTVSKVLHKPTGVLMAMKEVRLELDETKFTQILMELEILHKCDSPYIVDFYGAFFIEGAVYMCIEYMDGVSLDKIYKKDEGIKDEACLAFITECVIRGLKELKDEHNIIHRDVKPTNILVNTLGKVKLCDFGVSGNLVASLARTNIGCQSYMAPERIKSMSPDDPTYSTQADIWSLGLTILEVASGCYPYPAETYDNIFSQLSAIVDGDAPRLDPKLFSKDAQLFVKSCLRKDPHMRPSYDILLNHPWLVKHRNVDPHMKEYVTRRVREREEENEKKGISRSGSINRSKPVNTENVHSLLQNKVKAPALHRGGAYNMNKKFSQP